MQKELHTDTQITIDTNQVNDIDSTKALFTQKAYSNILDACIKDLTQFPFSVAACSTLSVTSKAMLTKAQIAFALAERDALLYVKRDIAISFGKLVSSLKCKNLIHSIATKHVTSICARVGISASSINLERIKATLLLFISYKASQQQEQLIRTV